MFVCAFVINKLLNGTNCVFDVSLPLTTSTHFDIGKIHLFTLLTHLYKTQASLLADIQQMYRRRCGLQARFTYAGFRPAHMMALNSDRPT